MFIKDGDTGGNLFGKVISHRLSENLFGYELDKVAEIAL